MSRLFISARQTPPYTQIPTTHQILCVETAQVHLGHHRLPQASRRTPVVNLAVLSRLFRRTIARVITQFILTHRIRMLTRIAIALIQRVNFAISTGGTQRAIAHVAFPIRNSANPAVLARIRLAVVPARLAVLPVVPFRTRALVSRVDRRANPAVLARRSRAEVHLGLAMPPHETRFTVAMVVVDQLDAVQSTGVRARVRQTLVDVALAARTHEPWRTLAIEAADLIQASTVIVASAGAAVVDVDLAQEAESTRGTTAREPVDQIVTSATVLARVGFAVVDVELAILPLEAFGAVARVRPDEVLTRGTVLAGG